MNGQYVDLFFVVLYLWLTASLFAQQAAAKQLVAFRRWGVLADWQTGCYYSYDKHYEVNQLEIFYQMYEKARTAASFVLFTASVIWNLITLSLQEVWFWWFIKFLLGVKLKNFVLTFFFFFLCGMHH